MATNTQIAYRRQGETHMFMGADRLSNGVMVGNTDLLKAYDEVGRLLEAHLPANHEINASVRCTVPRDRIEQVLAAMPTCMTLWELDIWR